MEVFGDAFNPNFHNNMQLVVLENKLCLGSNALNPIFGWSRYEPAACNEKIYIKNEPYIKNIIIEV